MKQRLWINALLITGVFLMSVSFRAEAAAHDGFYQSDGKQLTAQQAVAKLAACDVIFFGEYHDNAWIHEQEKIFLAALYQAKPNLLLSLEMFERDVQPYLDDYLADRISEADFLANTRPWKNYTADYRPCLAFAKEKRLPVLGGNIPRYLAAKYAKSGTLDTMTEAEKKYLPQKHTAEKGAYYDAFTAYMQSGEIGMKLSGEQIERYYKAQCLKDDTMAESIVIAARQDPARTIFHLQGEFHGRDRLGVIEKVRQLNPALRTGLITSIYVQSAEEKAAAVKRLGKDDIALIIEK